MARNEIKKEFRTPKMAAGKLKKNPYQSQMARNAIKSDFRHPKWPPAAILS